MSCRITHLWDALAEDERSMRWLARRTGYSHYYFSLLKSGARPTCSDEFALRVSAVMGVPLENLFARIPDPRREEDAAD